MYEEELVVQAWRAYLDHNGQYLPKLREPSYFVTTHELASIGTRYEKGKKNCRVHEFTSQRIQEENTKKEIKESCSSCSGWKQHGSTQRASDLTFVHPSIQALLMEHMRAVGKLSDPMLSLDDIQAHPAHRILITHPN